MNTEKIIKQYFENYPEIIAAYVYGSYASGEMHHQSDLDIAILCKRDKIPSFFEIQQMKTELNIRLKKEVDLVCLNHASPILQKQVISKGKPILIKDQHQLDLFIIQLLTDYIDFKITRRPIEKKVLTRKVF